MHKSLRIGAGSAALVLACLALPGARAAEKEAGPLEPLDRFVGGAWVGAGKGPVKGDFRTKVVYEWGINRKLLKARSYLVGPKGEQLVYESVFGWHPRKKRIFFYSFAAAGSIFEGTLEPKKDSVELLFESHAAGGSATFRQTIRFVDRDNTEWTVFRKDGDRWVKIIDAKQHREGGPPRKN